MAAYGTSLLLRNISISESEMKIFIDEMINKKLIQIREIDQGLDSLQKKY